MSKLTVPEKVRESTSAISLQEGQDAPVSCVTWVIEIASQVLFSISAAVHFELLISRDEKSLDLGFGNLIGQGQATPAQLEDHQESKRSKDGHHGAAHAKGVYSHAIKLLVEDTAALWNKPPLPSWDDEKNSSTRPGSHGLVNGKAKEGKVDLGESKKEQGDGPPRKRRKIHLVVLTHGLHSNLGADMLYLKESIDATARQAREDRRKRKARERQDQASAETHSTKHQTETERASSEDQNKPKVVDGQDAEDDEEVVVRGFQDNACRTERGIQYLGKRLAKYILTLTYPDQPFLPAKKSVRKKITRVLSGDSSTAKGGLPEHKNSSIYKPVGKKPDTPAYQITSISFIAHSLGGLTQTYAIAYINKHSPHFFDEIKPINFVALAAPFLGLSNENPLYVKFALDFGLVGRTGQDLGLTWKSTAALRGGWDSMIAGIGAEGQRAPKQQDPGSKPLLRILPTGHTHHVLKMFRNRTLYSNVVNDGIVPLRTSCLLFLDWSGLGRVEKARRDNGLVAGLAGWGWAELTGANASSRHLRAEPDSDVWSQSNVSSNAGTPRSLSQSRRPSSRQVPQPEENDVNDDEATEGPKRSQFLSPRQYEDEAFDSSQVQEAPSQSQASPFAGFLSFFRPGQNKTNQKSHHHSPKQTKIYKRSQTVRINSSPPTPPANHSNTDPSRRPSNVRGNSVLDDPESLIAPPKTTIFESAGDILNPPLPTQEYLMSPQSRPRTIFHDRVYHPEDIPPPPVKRPSRIKRSISGDRTNSTPIPSAPPSRASTNYDSTAPPGEGDTELDLSGMRVEEKIARAYHHGLSWRKVLVRLEPDAHNNMVVRRMFANAYGWPVIKHLVDTHFADTYEAETADRHEPNVERAKPADQPVGLDGEECTPVASRDDIPTTRKNTVMSPKRTDSETAEASDLVPEIRHADTASSISHPSLRGKDDVFAGWDDKIFEGSDDDSDVDGTTPHPKSVGKRSEDDVGTTEAEIDAFLHRKPILTPAVGDDGNGKVGESPSTTTNSLGLGKELRAQLREAREDGSLGAEEVSKGKASVKDEEKEKDLSEALVENGH